MSPLPNPLFRPTFGGLATVDSPTLTNTIAPMAAPSAPALDNSVTLPRDTPADTARRNYQDIVSRPAGVDTIKNPVGRIAARVGDITASVFAPRVAQFIPGTTLNHERQVGIAAQRAKTAEEQEQSGVTLEDSRAQAKQRAALATQEEAKAAALANPQKAGDPTKTVQTHDGVYQFNPDTGKYDVRVGDNKPKYSIHDTEAGPLFVNESTGQAQHLSVDGAPVGPKIKLTQSQPIMGDDGKPHTYMLNDKGEKVVDLGIHYERPITVNAGQNRAAKNDVLKAYQPTLDSAERMNVMTENYEKAIKDHDQQAMLSLLANHLGMTMGLQKGARLTKDIIREAQQSQPWLQGVAAKFDKDGYLAGVTLSPNQMRQMVGLGQSRYSEDAKKSRATAQYLGAPDDGPQRIPNAATIRYYTSLASGDATKAKQLAADDGWSVQ